MRGRTIAGIAFGVTVVALFAVAVLTPLGDLLSVEGLSERHVRLLAAVAERPLQWTAAFFLACLLATALCFPAGPIIGISAGALFGFWHGLAIVAAAAPAGSTLAFLASRYCFRDWVRERLPARLTAVERFGEAEAALYVLSLRWNPFVPYWLVNLGVGVTGMRLALFVPLAVVGLFPALFLYVSAGSELAALAGGAAVFPVGTIAALVLLSLLPILAARLGAKARLRLA